MNKKIKLITGIYIIILIFIIIGCSNEDQDTSYKEFDLKISDYPPQIVLRSENTVILPELGNFKWMVDEENIIEETDIDPIKLVNELESIVILSDEKFTIENSNDAIRIELYKIVNEEPVRKRSKSGEFSFYPPNEIGTHMYYIDCKWGYYYDSSALYVYKVEIKEPLELTGDIEGIVNEFRKVGFNIELRKYADRYLFIDPIVLNIGDEMVKIYKYESLEDVGFQKSLISKDGTSIITLEELKKEEEENIEIESSITWNSYPHFYSKDDLIAFYVGENGAIINILEKIFGSTFAGY